VTTEDTAAGRWHVSYRAFADRRDTAEAQIYILSRNEGGTWLPFCVGLTTDVAARIDQHFRAGRLGPGTRWTILRTKALPIGGPSAGVEQIAINLFGRKNAGRGSLENEIDALAKPGKR
jgi:hypothetical protein